MKLYIGNIPYSASEADVRAALEEFEPLEDFYYPIDRDTGNPRGFAFATLSSRELGEKAIEDLDGVEFEGRELRVREAEERKPRHGGGGGGGGGFKKGNKGGGKFNKGRGGGGGDRDWSRDDRRDDRRGGGRDDRRGGRGDKRNQDW